MGLQTARPYSPGADLSLLPEHQPFWDHLQLPELCSSFSSFFFFLLAGFQNGGATVNGDVFQVRSQPLALAP